MTRNAILLLLAFLLPVGVAQAQTGKIAGTITDAETGDPLPGVNVVVVGTTTGTTTDVEGNYSILNVSPGQYSVRASFIGYTPQLVEGVRVSIDLTTEVDFELQEETVGLDEVVVTATTPIIQRDISGSQRNISVDEVQAAPFQTINSVITSQVGINSIDVYEDRPQIRGSNMDESLFLVDGVAQGDPLTNRPTYAVNLDAIEEVKIQTGGFSAEYGDLRSGIINVVTKEGGERYTGSLDFQYSAPGFKHFGPMITGHQSPIVVPLVDPDAGAFSGVDSQGNGNLIFEGWENVSTGRLNPGDAHYDRPGELYARWLWRHRSQDSIDELKQIAEQGYIEKGGKRYPVEVEFVGDADDYVLHEYGIEPDWKASATLGGPVPFTNNRVRFFGSYQGRSVEYAFRTVQPTFEERQFRGKLTTRLGQNIKLNLNGFYGWQTGSAGTAGNTTTMLAANPFRTGLGRGTFDTRKIWYPNCIVPLEEWRQVYSAQMTHALSANTFYDVQLTHRRTDYDRVLQHRDTAPVPGARDPEGNVIRSSVGGSGVSEGRIGTDAEAEARAAAGQEGWEDWRDWTRIKIGGHWYDEAPYGHGPANWKDVTNRYPMETCPMPFNDAYSRTYEAKANFTSQINQTNQVKAGVQVQFDDLNDEWESLDAATGRRRLFQSSAEQWRGAAYAQDKLEFEGFIANIGLRGDWLLTGKYPMVDYDAFDDDVAGPYSKFLQPGHTQNEEGQIIIGENIPQRRVTHFYLSPRLGISHPISSVGKIFFNYGHMIQWPSAHDLYRTHFQLFDGGRPDQYGNPALEPPRTISYELGYEQNLFDRMNLRLTGYYKDIKKELSSVQYRPLGFGGSNYQVTMNRRFRDVRGLETFLELRRGVVPFVSGWGSFNYMAQSGGRFGYDRFWEDPSRQPREVSAQVSNPDVRPIIKFNLDLHTRESFGPDLGGFRPVGGLTLNLLYTWQRGAQFTWNPDRIPYVEDNIRWRPYQRVDLRFRKNLISAGRFDALFYVDVTNVFNHKNMTRPDDGAHSGRWAWDLHDWWNSEWQDYMESLDLEVERDGGLRGDDRPGDFPDGWPNYAFVPINEVEALPESGDPGALYRTVDGYYQFVDGAFQQADQGFVEEVKDEKRYIDMPAFTPWTFLERRDIYFGIKLLF